MNEKFILHQMQFNEFRWIDGNIGVRRVPGGWIYEYMEYEGGILTAVFVPFNEEFKTVHT